MDKPEDRLLPDGTPQYEYDEYGVCLTRVFVSKGVPEWKKASASPTPLLSDKNIETLRTLDELERFIQTISEKADSQLLERAHLRLASGSAKKLREEVWPWRYFLRAQSFGKTCRFAVQPHGAQADVVLTMETGEEIPVQITVAVEGEQQANRMEALTRNGSVSGNATITKEKEYKSGYILSWSRKATPVEPVVGEIAARVENRITEKDKKGYPPTTWLLVDIEECGFAHWGAEHVNRVINTAKTVGKETCFARIYLLSGETCWQVK